MRRAPISTLLLLLAVACIRCERDGGTAGNGTTDFSGTYCLNTESLEMTIVQTGSSVTFEVDPAMLVDGTGTIHGDTLYLAAATFDAGTFVAAVVLSEDGEIFSGPYEIGDSTGATAPQGTLVGTRGECPTYDIEANGVPRFVTNDCTELSKVEAISKFRSSAGHSFADDSETCRSMKHYYSVYEESRENGTVAIFSPVDGTITSVSNDGHGASIGLNNKQIRIRSDDQPAFTILLFHCDLGSPAVAVGKQVQAGELLGHARLYYDDLDEHAGSFDITVWVNTPSGMRLVSFFDTMDDAVFSAYVARGAISRQDFIITKAARDTDPLECDGEAFLTQGSLDSWVALQ